jgi:putative ABC transport system ATP-binding protein
MIATKNLKYSYDNEHWLIFPNLECESNDILLLLGKSGVGKTTLLHLIGGLMPSKSGEIYIGDNPIHQFNTSQLDAFRGKNIGIIFQQAHFVQSITNLENLLLAQSLAGATPDKKKCLDLLAELGIDYKANDKPSNLSQGEKQRLSIARALINNPTVVLADEPTSALDDENTAQVLNLLKNQAKSINAALIIVTHDARLKDVISHQITLSE